MSKPAKSSEEPTRPLCASKGCGELAGPRSAFCSQKCKMRARTSTLSDSLCECGCGERTYLNQRGFPYRFRHGHSARLLRAPVRWDVDPATGCWSWKGGVRGDGRGRLTRDGQPMYAYRWVYERHVGPIPEGWHLHHSCENPNCVNPAHLTPLSPGDHASLHIGDSAFRVWG